MGDDTMTATMSPPRTEDEIVHELTDLLFKVKMLEFELRRVRDPRGPAFFALAPGEVDVEWEIAAARARSLAKLEASI